MQAARGGKEMHWCGVSAWEVAPCVGFFKNTEMRETESGGAKAKGRSANIEQVQLIGAAALATDHLDVAQGDFDEGCVRHDKRSGEKCCRNYLTRVIEKICRD
jgi:hypothetical protein